MKNFFLQMLDSHDPAVSSSRFLSIITTFAVLYTWLWVSIYTRTVQDIPVGVYTFAGLVIAGKTVEKFADRPMVGTTTVTETKSKSVTGKTK